VDTGDGALVYKARDFVEARALAAFLSNVDIDAHVAGGVTPNVFGVSNIGPSSGAEVWINAADRAKAEELIRDWRAEHGGLEQAREKPSQFALMTLFKAMVVVAVVAGTARILGSLGVPRPRGGRGTDFQNLVAAAAIWFWAWVAYLSVKFTIRRWRGDDDGDADPNH
jgi:hypothetical protein